jgi:hypothetical protein
MYVVSPGQSVFAVSVIVGREVCWVREIYFVLNPLKASTFGKPWPKMTRSLPILTRDL